jgi:hypothetical protein
VSDANRPEHNAGDPDVDHDQVDAGTLPEQEDQDAGPGSRPSGAAREQGLPDEADPDAEPSTEPDD